MDLGEALFAEVMLAKNNTKHAALSLVTAKVTDGDKASSVKMRKVISRRWSLKL